MQPNESNDPQVTISQAEYSALRQQANTSQPIVGQTPGPALDPSAGKTTTREKVWFGLGLAVLSSFLIPSSRYLFLPIFLFGILAIKSFVDDTHHTKPKGVLLTFKFIAWVGIGLVVGATILFILLIAAFSASGV